VYSPSPSLSPISICEDGDGNTLPTGPSRNLFLKHQKLPRGVKKENLFKKRNYHKVNNWQLKGKEGDQPFQEKAGYNLPHLNSQYPIQCRELRHLLPQNWRIQHAGGEELFPI
jgi:hypothetical protein